MAGTDPARPTTVPAAPGARLARPRPPANTLFAGPPAPASLAGIHVARGRAAGTGPPASPRETACRSPPARPSAGPCSWRAGAGGPPCRASTPWVQRGPSGTPGSAEPCSAGVNFRNYFCCVATPVRGLLSASLSVCLPGAVVLRHTSSVCRESRACTAVGLHGACTLSALVSAPPPHEPPLATARHHASSNSTHTAHRHAHTAHGSVSPKVARQDAAAPHAAYAALASASGAAWRARLAPPLARPAAAGAGAAGTFSSPSASPPPPSSSSCCC